LTVGQREFVLDRAGHSDAGSLLAGLLGALESSFTVTEGRHRGTLRRSWLDTFDWRLYQAGLALEYASGRSRHELILTDVQGQPIATQQVGGAAGGRVRWPCLANALPTGPVRDQVESLARPRALLPVAAVTSVPRELRLLNADDKVVARLTVNRMTVTRATGALSQGADVAGPAAAAHRGAGSRAGAQVGLGGHAVGAELPVRLAIEEVRGYPGQARRVAAILAGVPGVFASRQPTVEDALAAVGRRPLEYSNKVDTGSAAGLAAQTPAGSAVTSVLLRLLDTLEANVNGVLRDIDTEFLHDLRVSVRRTRAALKLLGDVLPPEMTTRFAAEFKWLGDLTTPTRDLDVYLLGLDSMTAGLIAATPQDLEPFLAYLAKRRAAEARTLARGLRSARFHAIMEDWRKALFGVRDSVTGAGRESPVRRALGSAVSMADSRVTAGAVGSASAAARARPGSAGRATGARRDKPSASGSVALNANDLAAGRTRRVYQRAVKLGYSITDASPPEFLHDLRKRCKEIRYLLEFFAPLHDPVAYRATLGDLKRLQDCLGDFQDSQVQREEIQSFAAAMLDERAAPAATLLAMGELAAQLSLRQRKARAEFAERFGEFAGPRGRRRIEALMTGAVA
jgi:CHAD domain-containing protein